MNTPVTPVTLNLSRPSTASEFNFDAALAENPAFKNLREAWRAVEAAQFEEAGKLFESLLKKFSKKKKKIFIYLFISFFFFFL